MGEPRHEGQMENVLIVDDDQGIRRALERSLGRLGYEVHQADRGEAGFQLATEIRPKVIFSDIRMPGMDGHTLLRRLNTSNLDAAVVIMSGSGTMDDVIDVLRHGAVDYLRKPWAPSDLIAAVGRAVEIHDSRRAARKFKLETPPAASGTDSSLPAAGTGLPPAPATPFTAILEQLRSGELEWPAFPPVLAELRALLSKPDSAITQIAALVERDPRLAAQVLRITNTSQFSRGARIADIRTAVSRIGLRHLSSIVQTVVSRHSLKSKNGVLERLQARGWRYAIARAVAMRGFGELLGGGDRLDPELAYVSGLLADVGFFFFLDLINKCLERGVSLPSDPEDCARGLNEQHSEVGGAILTRWQVDPVAIAIARSHHAPSPPSPPSQYWCLSVLGAAMADDLTGEGDPTGSEAPNPERVERCYAQLSIGASAAAKIADSVRREFDGVMDALT